MEAKDRTGGSMNADDEPLPSDTAKSMGRREFVALGALGIGTLAVGGLAGCAGPAQDSGQVPSTEGSGTAPLAGAKAGDIVHLGTVSFIDYQGSKFSEDVGWRVLAVGDGRALVVPEGIVDIRPYNEEREDVTWEGCGLREWLNGGFYDGLPDGMKEGVLTTQVVNDGNPDYGTPGGNGTSDKVFLLSIGEAEEYFSNNDDRVAKYKGGGCWWWLRSPGGFAYCAAGVGVGGHVYDGGDYVNFGFGVRPALWLNL